MEAFWGCMVVALVIVLVGIRTTGLLERIAEALEKDGGEDGDDDGDGIRLTVPVNGLENPRTPVNKKVTNLAAYKKFRGDDLFHHQPSEKGYGHGV
ncbi:MAG: hypothetical protein HYT62_00690 [Candidatus Yanofskybacteria bacterium]|nr:hypothetical protein [Candidatus Yanofskybacteria bacterium]